MIYSQFKSLMDIIFDEITTRCVPEAIMLDLKGAMSSEGVSLSNITGCELEIKQYNEKCCVSEGITITASVTATSATLDFSPIGDAYTNVYGLFGKLFLNNIKH